MCLLLCDRACACYCMTMNVPVIVWPWLCLLLYDHDCACYCMTINVPVIVWPWLCLLLYDHDCACYCMTINMPVIVWPWLCLLLYDHDCAYYCMTVTVPVEHRAWCYSPYIRALAMVPPKPALCPCISNRSVLSLMGWKGTHSRSLLLSNTVALQMHTVLLGSFESYISTAYFPPSCFARIFCLLY